MRVYIISMKENLIRIILVNQLNVAAASSQIDKIDDTIDAKEYTHTHILRSKEEELNGINR